MTNREPSPAVRVAAAVCLCVVFAGVGFYFGSQLPASAPVVTAPTTSSTMQTSAGTTDYFSDVAIWPEHQRDDAGISVKVPLDFPISDDFSGTPKPNWRMYASNDDKGIKVFEFTIPKVFEPQTNFDDATFSVAHSGDSQAIKNCLTPDQNGGPTVTSTTETINGTTFSVFHAADAGLGNRYNLTSYRTVHAGQCYAIEFSVHSTVTGAYPPEYGVKEFDEKKLDDLFHTIIGTFKFE